MNNIRFRTPIEIVKSSHSINHLSPMMAVGSCFSTHMGERMLKSGFSGIVNPFGVIYNPISIANALTRIAKNKNYDASELICYNGQWLSFDHHGKYAETDCAKTLKNINDEIALAHQFINQNPVIIITLGSAHVYELKSTGKIVANCHKIKSSEFEKRLLSVDSIVDCYSALFNALPALNVIFTISPVRYLSDGFFENQLSKATLHLSVAALKAKFPQIHYFPAYEILNDDLRDYRFYADDLVHPSLLAIDYIWDQFMKTFFDVQTQNVILAVESLQKAINHRFLHNKSSEQRLFLEAQIKKINQLITDYPHINLFDLKQQFIDKLQNL